MSSGTATTTPRDQQCLRIPNTALLLVLLGIEIHQKTGCCSKAGHHLAHQYRLQQVRSHVCSEVGLVAIHLPENFFSISTAVIRSLDL